MAIVIANVSMSLDRFVADITDNAQDVLERFGNGVTEVPAAIQGIGFRTSEMRSAYLRGSLDHAGATVIGGSRVNLSAGSGGAHRSVYRPLWYAIPLRAAGWPTLQS